MTSFLEFPFGKQVCVHSDVKSTISCLHKIVPFPDVDYYFVCRGQRMLNSDPITDGCTYHVVPRLEGGKGGFGSMLRAIGAQIEKTTSREACRDLSGRRMRDVNNEKKLREWVASKAEREREREERRKERMERRRAVPKHCFNDPNYEEQKRTVVDNLDDALQEGLIHAGISSESRKRRSDEAGSSMAKKSRFEEGQVCDELSDLEFGSDYSESEERASPGPQPGSSSSSQSGDLGVSPVGKPGSFDQGEKQSVTEESFEVIAKQNGMATGSTTSTSSVLPAIGCETMSTKKAETTPTESIQATPTKNAESTHPDKPDAIRKTETMPSEKTEEKSPESEEQYTGPVEVDLLLYSGAEQLETLGLEVLKAALMARGLKCGGTLSERATRLYSVKGLSNDQIKPSLFSKGGKVKGKGKN